MSENPTPEGQDLAALPLTAHDVLAWACERYQNTQRIAALKSGADRDGWLEDGAYWRAIVESLLAGWHKEASGSPAPDLTEFLAYVQHKPNCPRWLPKIKLELGPGWTDGGSYVKPCTCGLNAVLTRQQGAGQ